MREVHLIGFGPVEAAGFVRAAAAAMAQNQALDSRSFSAGYRLALCGAHTSAGRRRRMA